MSSTVKWIKVSVPIEDENTKKDNCLKITIATGKNTPKEFTLRDVLGDEFNDYYDGSGYDRKTKTHEYFFNNVPQSLLGLVSDRIKDYSFIKHSIN